MGEKEGSSALMRIEQFKDNETEQVWELFKNEFRDASRQLDGELGWMLVSGELRVEDVEKDMSKEIPRPGLSSSDSSRTSRHLPKTCLSPWSSMAVKTTVRE